MDDEVVTRVEGLGKRYSLRHQRDQRYVALQKAELPARRAYRPEEKLKSDF